MIAFLKAHKRAIVPGLALAWTLFLLVHPDEWGRFVDLSLFALFVMLIASQFFWFGRILDLAKRALSGNSRRAWLAAVAWLLYVFVFFQCIVVLGIVLTISGFLLLHPPELVGNVDQSFFVCFVMLLASQYFLIRRVLDVGEQVLPGRPRPRWLAAAACMLCMCVVRVFHSLMESANDPHLYDRRLYLPSCAYY